MREWNLVADDPLELSLSADFRLCNTDYFNDHIWELKIGGGDPSALALTTTFGLRAKVMRIFPGFSLGGKSKKNTGADAITDPASFHRSIHIHHFYPNYLQMDFLPFQGISAAAEYWVPDSHSVAGRFTVSNDGEEPQTFFLSLFGQLSPIDGQSFSPITMQSIYVLAGKTSNLYPVIFITGGPQMGQGALPSLSLEISLSPGGRREFTWVQAALDNPQASFDMARRIAARSWESERTRVEMVNASQSIDIYTGDPDWDAAFSFSQKSAFHLFHSPTQHLANPSFVLARQPDHGYSQRGDGNDYRSIWNGQPPLDSYFLANVLPGAPELAIGLVKNFLSSQSKDGLVDCKPGLAGQRGRALAAPILSTLAWNLFQKTRDAAFLSEIQEGLTSFLRCWFNEDHDRDQDGFPEWDNLLQYGFEDNPAFNIWHANGQGADISIVENPGLSAMLGREARSLAQIANLLDKSEEGEKWLLKSGEMGALTEECWNADASLYHNRDRDSHNCPVGQKIKEFPGSGRCTVNHSFRQPTRLIIQIILKEEITRRVEFHIRGKIDNRQITERLERMSFQWGQGIAVATTHHLFKQVGEIEIIGLDEMDKVIIKSMDLSEEDLTLFLPLWADIPHSQRAQTMVDKALFDTERFWGKHGIPACPGTINPPDNGVSQPNVEPYRKEVHLPWNILIGEALIGYDLRVQAAELVTRLISAVITNLKQQLAFARSYDSETGMGIGERNALQGLAPVGFFLQTLGLEIESNKCVHLHGMNPFPWPVTVKYRGLTVTREKRQTLINFPNGQTRTINDPTDSIVSIE